jgi:flagellar FliL protein
VSEEAVADEFDSDLDSPAKKKLSGKKIVIFIALPLLLLGGGGAGAYFMGLFGGGGGHQEAHAGAEPEHAPPPPPKTVFYELPEMIVNLNTANRRPSYLKIRVSLELANEGEISRIETMRPRIIDNFQVYLRELRVDDLKGSEGVYRLREELLARVNAAIDPGKVENVLFKEILVQ